MLTGADRAYLLSRSYTETMLDAEEVRSLTAGRHLIEGVEVSVHFPVVAWTCRSMSGQVCGIQTRRTDEHEYRWNQAPKAQHLPILYGTDEDHELFYRTGRVIVTEGIFDRAAIKQCVPDYAVYARLSKGIAKHLIFLMLRYGKQLWTAFDQDGPGEKATESTKLKLGERLEVNQLKIPAKDPAKLLEQRGLKRTKEIVEKQIRALEY